MSSCRCTWTMTTPARTDSRPRSGRGRLRYSYLHSALREWIGDGGDIVFINAQYRGINYKGDTLTCSGRVTGKREENGRHLVDVDIAITNQRGEVVTPGNGTVALPSRG